MKKLLIFILLAIFFITSGLSAQEENCGNLNCKPDEEINENTDLFQYLLSKENIKKEELHISSDTAENLIKKSTSGIVAPHFMEYWKKPFYFPRFVKSICNEIGTKWEDEKGIYNIYLISINRTGYNLGRMESYIPSMEPAEEYPVENALKEMFEYFYGEDFKETTVICRIDGVEKTIKLQPDTKPQSDTFTSLHPEVQSLIAEYLLSLLNAIKYRNLAFRELQKEKFANLYAAGTYHFLSARDEEDKNFMEMVEEKTGEASTELEFDMARKFDYNDLYWGGLPLVMSTIKMKQFISDPKEKGTTDEEGKEIPGPAIDISRTIEFETPYGKFAFNGKEEDNDYDCMDYLSIIDCGGKDTYRGPAGASLPERPAATVIDRQGDDTYISDKECASSQGSGIMGYGFLIDMEGNDTYTSYDNSQGSAFFGVGLLWDEEGNDTFSARNMTQGAGAYGVGNLVNIGGDDRYYCFMCGQAFGYVGGCGILLDTEGNDIYTGETGKDDPENNLINPASKGHDGNRNYSFVQGAGWGRRADLRDGHSMGGGVGILVDIKGSDTYECGVYGQATGYWYGTGILNDMEGDDSYEGSFYVQSGTAHMGMTELLDESGNDTYRVWKAISQGGAHDFSLSWFIDKKGNDRYLCFEEETGPEGSAVKTSGGVMIGSAITNSLAIHIDYGGDDYYETVNSTTLGYCLMRTGPSSYSFRYEEWTAGIMIDRGGKDIYVRTLDTELEPEIPSGWPVPQNNGIWKEVCQPGNPEFSFGMGLDCEKGIIMEVEY